MPKILLFGAGKSSTILIDFLVVQCFRHRFSLEVVDAQPRVAEEKLQESAKRAGILNTDLFGHAYDILNAAKRSASIHSADLVLSLLPPHLHAIVADDCIRMGKSLFTASYVDDAIRQRKAEIESTGILFLYEMGLDPGIDHMSLMALLDSIRSEGGTPLSVLSHCGGLVAPESDDNPWHYKISWNPRNVVMAGSAGAQYLKNGRIIEKSHAQLFADLRTVKIDASGELAYYPNRDSLSYIDRYGLQGIGSFQRTTLRHPDFIRGWNELIKMGMVDDRRVLVFTVDTSLAEGLQQCAPMPIDLPSDLRSMLEWLGWADHKTILPFLSSSPSAVLQFAMEQKWKLNPGDKDQIVMLHEIEYQLGQQIKKLRSLLVITGEDPVRTAMAKTVGLPIGIAAIQYLTGRWEATGLQIPTLPEIYGPVLEELKVHGISFTDSHDQ